MFLKCRMEGDLSAAGIRKGRKTLFEIMEQARAMMDAWNRTHPAHVQHLVFRADMIGTVSFSVRDVNPYVKTVIRLAHNQYALYDTKSLSTVMELTKMGNTAVKEETDYLIRGGLIDDDRESLTELGTQYGRLLERFEQLSEGMGVAFNTFANIFEPIEEKGYYSEVEQGYILPNHFIPTLARNDNYANSLDIAKEQIEEDIPFSYEIKHSLYTTVRIEKSALGYKRLFLRDFSRCYVSDREASIKIAIPYDRIQCRPRYAWIDPYRSVLLNLCDISKEYSELLTDEAKFIIKTAAEEDNAEIITVDADTITGELKI